MARLNWHNMLAIMKAHRWNWADISRHSGLTQQQLCDLRKGRRRVTMDIADVLCDTLSCSYDTLLNHPTVNAPMNSKQVLALAEDNAHEWAQEYHRTRMHRAPRTEYQRMKRIVEGLADPATTPRQPLVKLYGHGV